MNERMNDNQINVQLFYNTHHYKIKKSIYLNCLIVMSMSWSDFY